MTNTDPHTFMRPYVRAIYLTDTAIGQLQTQFVSLEGLRAWAALRGLALRDAMSDLLEQHIWPERFRRNFGLVAAHDLARRLQSRVLVLGCGVPGLVGFRVARAGVTVGGIARAGAGLPVVRLSGCRVQDFGRWGVHSPPMRRIHRFAAPRCQRCPGALGGAGAFA